MMRGRKVGCGLLLALVIGGATRVGMGATVSVLNQLVPDSEGVLTAVRGMVQVRTKTGAEWAWTKSEFKTPLAITAVVQTDSNEIRSLRARDSDF